MKVNLGNLFIFCLVWKIYAPIFITLCSGFGNEKCLRIFKQIYHLSFWLYNFVLYLKENWKIRSCAIACSDLNHFWSRQDGCYYLKDIATYKRMKHNMHKIVLIRVGMKCSFWTYQIQNVRRYELLSS